MQNEIRYIDLFGGIGGFRLGIKKSGLKANCVFYSDIDKFAVQIYNKNFNENHKPTDIRKIRAEEIPEFDMLCGGFPCQAFSLAGKRRGFEDTRGTLFFEIARIAKSKRPKIIWLENVKGLLSHKKGKTFGCIIQTLAELGYDCQWMVLNSKFFGVPQSRQRVFIIATLPGKCSRKVFFDQENSKEMAARMQKEEQASFYCLTTGSPTNSPHETTIIKDGKRFRVITPLEAERLQGFPDNWTQGVSDTQRYKQLGNAVTVNVIKAIAERIF